VADLDRDGRPGNEAVSVCLVLSSGPGTSLPLGGQPCDLDANCPLGLACRVAPVVDDARLGQAIERLKARLQKPEQSGPDLNALLKQLLPAVAPPKPRPIQASLGREIKLIAPEDVVYFESDNRYTRVVFDGGEALIRTPLKELLATLDTELFWQLHRSVLVNSRHIASAVRVDENSMHITLKGREEKLPVSRQFQGLFKGQ